jgi:vitamin B12 transporter
MRLPCPPRLARAICSLIIPVAYIIAPAPVWAADTLSGIVVDQSGRAVPRAFVRAVAGNGVEMARTFADESGRFIVSVGERSSCSVEVTLTGFEPALVPCSAFPNDGSRRVELRVSPVRETVLVTATRTEAPTGQIGASVTVLTSEDLERRQMPLLADLLTTTPGAMVVRSGAPGSLTSLFVRGGESDYNKVLLDGVPLNEPGGSFYLNNLTTEHLDRVEIVRGAYSSLFGSDAMSSVIQLFTRRADGAARRPRVSAQLDGGTYGTTHATASVSGAGGRVDYTAGAAQFNSDNRAPNSRLENTTLTANIGIALAGAATLRFVGRAEVEHVGTPGPTAFGRPDMDAFFERADGVFSISLDQRVLRTVRQRVMYSISRSSQTSTNVNLDPPFRATFEGRTAIRTSSDFLNDRYADFRHHHASYQIDARLADGSRRGSHLLTVLADWDGERADQEDRLAPTSTRNIRNNFGVSAQQQVLWRRVFLTAGGRIEHNESFGTVAVPRGTLAYVVRRGSTALGETRIKISGGAGIKEPTMLESFSVSPFFLGNPNLRPERSRSYEVGFDQRFARDRAKFEAAWFHNMFSNIISLATTNPATFEAQFANVGVTRARGLELGAEVAPVPALRARASYTFLDSKIVETAAPGNPLFAPGQWAARRPRHSGTVGATFQWKRITADATGVFVGRFVDSDSGLFNPPFIENPGHTAWDGRLTVAITPKVSGLVAIDNLTNADYSEPLGYQPLRRVIRAGARVAF